MLQSRAKVTEALQELEAADSEFAARCTFTKKLFMGFVGVGILIALPYAYTSIKAKVRRRATSGLRRNDFLSPEFLRTMELLFRLVR